MGWRIISISVALFCMIGFKLPHADARIVVGVSTVNVAFLPIYLTQDRGFFKDEGLDVLVVMFNAGATNLQAVIGGDVQIMAGGVPETVLARASGVDIKNFWAISNVMPFQIYGSPSMKSLKDGKGKKFAGGGGPLNAIVGGWQFSPIIHFQSGTPMWFRSSTCQVVSQFRQNCLVGLVSGADPFLQSPNDYNPGAGPLLNAAAFEPLGNFCVAGTAPGCTGTYALRFGRPGS